MDFNSVNKDDWGDFKDLPSEDVVDARRMLPLSRVAAIALEGLVKRYGQPADLAAYEGLKRMFKEGRELEVDCVETSLGIETGQRELVVRFCAYSGKVVKRYWTKKKDDDLSF